MDTVMCSAQPLAYQYQAGEVGAETKVGHLVTKDQSHKGEQGFGELIVISKPKPPNEPDLSEYVEFLKEEDQPTVTENANNETEAKKEMLKTRTQTSTGNTLV